MSMWNGFEPGREVWQHKECRFEKSLFCFYRTDTRTFVFSVAESASGILRIRIMVTYEVGDGRQTATAKWGKSQGKGMDRVGITRTCRRRATYRHH